jgi:hypothetical protein
MTKADLLQVLLLVQYVKIQHSLHKCMHQDLCVIIWVAEVDLSTILRGSESSSTEISSIREGRQKKDRQQELPILVAVTRNTPSVAFHMVALPRVRPE